MDAILSRVDGAYLGRCLRVLRVRAGMRQEDLALKAGVSQQTVSRAECGQVASVDLRTLEALFAGVGASIDVRPVWRGAAIDRLLDGVHAALVASTIGYLERHRFRCEAEVSYSRYGERGSIDVLGVDVERSAVVVGEAKSEIASLEETLRRHDVKARLAPAICFGRWGWRPRHVARLLVLPDSMTARRQVERSAVVLRASLPGRAADLRAWLRRPAGEFAGVLFLPLAPIAGAREAPRAVSRVRRAGARTRELG